MTYRYARPILVNLADDGRPAQLRWRETEFPVRTVLAQWHRRERWRARGRITALSDRHYFRVDLDANLLCDIYHDAASDRWVLDLVHD